VVTLIAKPPRPKGISRYRAKQQAQTQEMEDLGDGPAPAHGHHPVDAQIASQLGDRRNIKEWIRVH
jgi:hypothetical protein